MSIFLSVPLSSSAPGHTYSVTRSTTKYISSTQEERGGTCLGSHCDGCTNNPDEKKKRERMQGGKKRDANVTFRC